MELYYIGIGMCMLGTTASAIGEGLICAHAIDNMGRNPEMYGKLRTAMILGCALDETTSIYCLLIAILLLFIH
ncbi:MAG: ATP synthase F0 subunit C [Bacilli bacterium]|jgi:F-type H+-transporting ATPase subunit c